MEHYSILYLAAVNQLLKDLTELKEYSILQYYAAKALQHEPGSAEIYYRLIYALMQLGSLPNAQAEYDRAKQMLAEPAFEDLRDRLSEEGIKLK